MILIHIFKLKNKFKNCQTYRKLYIYKNNNKLNSKFKILTKIMETFNYFRTFQKKDRYKRLKISLITKYIMKKRQINKALKKSI